MPPVIHGEDVRVHELAQGDIAFARRRLGHAAGCARIGVSLYAVPPGARQMPLHVHGDEEEIFFVLGGSGLAVTGDAACPVAGGDTIVHVASGRPHTFIAGDAGLDLLAFGSGSHTHLTWLPRAKVMWAGPRWIPGDGPHPFQAEADAGPLVPPAPGDRPSHVVALDRVAVQAWTDGVPVRQLGRSAGSQHAGLNHATLAPGVRGFAPHVHSLEEEAFYILDGTGQLMLGDESHPVRPGDVVARPPGSRVAHSLTAGEAGLTYLAYGTREPGDAVYRPESGVVRLRGLGVTVDARPDAG